MRGLKQQKHWNLLGISLFTTVIMIPAAVQYGMLSYISFTSDYDWEYFKSLVELHIYIDLLIGFYQPYLLLITSKELRREMLTKSQKFYSAFTKKQRVQVQQLDSVISWRC
ncbi:unnamed protein product, partial [Mesorhabditis belari]|uniref:Serpentine receptor class gamma n=1 Tax=Mesorhabditis belari TaxID=2138241 RepID=A0AAF3F9U7_9BILA